MILLTHSFFFWKKRCSDAERLEGQLYKHALGTGHRSALTRAEWRIYRFQAIKKLATSGGSELDGPDWLQKEVSSFTPAKWIQFWDRKTGKRKIDEEPRTRHSKKAGNKKKVRTPIGPVAIIDKLRSGSHQRQLAGEAIQSFSHGRKRTVVVEKLTPRKR